MERNEEDKLGQESRRTTSRGGLSRKVWAEQMGRGEGNRAGMCR